MKKLLCIFVIILQSHAAIVSAAVSGDGKLELELQEAFRAFHIVHYGLEYPWTQDLLDGCYAGKADYPCVKYFERVRDAKHFVSAQVRANPDRTLQITLDTIFSSGRPSPMGLSHAGQEENFGEATYYGAIMALYLFNRDEQDRQILARMKSASPKVLNDLFNISYEWLHNRPDPQRWVIFVETLSGKDFSEHAKKDIINTIRKSDYEKFGLMIEGPSTGIGSSGSGVK